MDLISVTGLSVSLLCLCFPRPLAMAMTGLNQPCSLQSGQLCEVREIGFLSCQLSSTLVLLRSEEECHHWDQLSTKNRFRATSDTFELNTIDAHNE